jgi:hypothetical protein
MLETNITKSVLRYVVAYPKLPKTHPPTPKTSVFSEAIDLHTR